MNFHRPEQLRFCRRVDGKHIHVFTSLHDIQQIIRDNPDGHFPLFDVEENSSVVWNYKNIISFRVYLKGIL